MLNSAEAVAREIRQKAYVENCDCPEATESEVFQSRLICEICLPKLIADALTAFATQQVREYQEALKQANRQIAEQATEAAECVARAKRQTWEKAHGLYHLVLPSQAQMCPTKECEAFRRRAQEENE